MDAGHWLRTTDSTARDPSSVSLVWPLLHATDDRRLGSAILLDRTPAGILDRGAPLDDAGDRDGPAIGGLLEGSPGERARCPRGISIGEGQRCIGIAVVDRLAAPLRFCEIMAHPSTAASFVGPLLPVD